MSEQEIVRVGAAFLTGWVFGMAFAVSVFWRRLTRPWRSDDGWRALREQLAEDDAQIRALYAQIGRLTARLALTACVNAMARPASDVAEAEADRSGRVA